MKARIKSSGELIEVTETPDQGLGGRYFDCPEHKCYYREDKLDFLPEKETAVLEGYVARDKSGYLVLHYKKPHRTYGNTRWYSAQSQKSLPRDSFPSVTWLTEPKKVRITLEAIEE